MCSKLRPTGISGEELCHDWYSNLPRIHADGFIEGGHWATRLRGIEMVGALRRYQPVAVHHEFVPLCLAAEDGMVFQHQALRLWSVLLASRAPLPGR